MQISVVLAAYNEEAVIAANLARICAALEAYRPGAWELVCVDDGSRDRTAALMEQASLSEPRIVVLRHRRNFGQGRAFRSGFARCRGAVVVTVDADLSYGPEYIARLADALEAQRVEIALASPYCAGGTVGRVPFYRLFLSRMGNRYLSWTLPYGVATSTCAVRAYRREVLDELVLTCDGMELQLEVLRKAAWSGFRVCEVPAHLDWGEVKAAEGGLARASKMRILRTIRTYLLLGLLASPALLPALLAAGCGLPGLLAVGLLVRRWALQVSEGQPLLAALDAVVGRSPGLALASVALLLAALVAALAALLLTQSRHQFEELYQVAQLTRRSGRA